MNNAPQNAPLVGLLYNPAVPYITAQAGELVEYVGLIPERFWYDLGINFAAGERFQRLEDEIDTFKRCSAGRVVAGHGVGLSLPSAVPLDINLLEQNASFAAEAGFAWYSEHLSVFLTPHASAPNAQAALGMPVVYDEETFEIVSGKVRRLQATLGLQVILENGSIFTAIPEMPMTEPEFLNRLYRETGCGMLLDLHNLYVTSRHGNADPEAYLAELGPDAVVEIHMAGGDELSGYYTDSHSRLSPDEVWSLAEGHVPRFRNLRAITFEFHETYFERLGVGGIAAELERMHDLAACRRESAEAIYA